jgi:hypothetical protein
MTPRNESSNAIPQRVVALANRQIDFHESSLLRGTVSLQTVPVLSEKPLTDKSTSSDLLSGKANSLFR